MSTAGGFRSSFVASAQRSIGPALREVSQLTGPARTSPKMTGDIQAKSAGDTVQAIAPTIPPIAVCQRANHIASSKVSAPSLRFCGFQPGVTPCENFSGSDRLRYHEDRRDQHGVHSLDQNADRDPDRAKEISLLLGLLQASRRPSAFGSRTTIIVAMNNLRAAPGSMVGQIGNRVLSSRK